MAMQDIFSALTGGGQTPAPQQPSPTLTPDSIKRKRILAELMQRDGLSAAPVQHWSQGAARVAQAMLGAWDEKDLDSKEAAGTSAATKAFNDIVGGGGGGTVAPVSSAQLPMADSAPATAQAGAPDDRAKQAFSYFVQQGHSPAAAAGIVGNLIQESKLNPGALNPGDGADGSNSIGVGQWNGPRAAALQQFAKSQGKDVGDFNTQLAFVQNELQGPENRVLKALQGVKDPTAAAGVFAGYERPQGWKEGGDPSAVHGWQNRSGQAQRLFAALGGQAPQQDPSAVAEAPQRPVQVASADPSFVPQMPAQGGPQPQRPAPQQMAQAPQAVPSGAGVDQGNPMVAQVTQLAAQPQVQQAAQAHAQTPEGQKMVQQAGGASVGQIMQAMQNPWMSDGQKSLLLMMAKQKIEQADPTHQLQIQKLQSEVSDIPLNRRSKELGNEKTSFELSTARANAPVDLASKYKALAKSDAPTEVQQFEYGQSHPGFNEWDQTRKKAGAIGVTIAGEDAFSKDVGSGQAKLFNEMVNEGVNAKSDVANIRVLREQMARLPGGFAGGMQAMANNYGIKVGPNVDAVEVTNALLSKLIPQQRQGMPGAASDRDVSMFRAALPQLNTTPEGRALILDTMEGLANYRLQQAQIASKVTTGKMNRADGIDALSSLSDPFEKVRAAGGQSRQGASAPPTVGVIDQGFRFKGGNPADPKSWEKVQ